MITATFGATNQYTVKYPDTQRIFAFQPNYVEVYGTSVALAAQTAITFTYNGFTLVRYCDANGVCTIPIQGILQSFFANVEFGEVKYSESASYMNADSKLMKAGKTLTIKVGTDTNTKVLTFDIIWGALQVNKTEPNTVYIYEFTGGTGNYWLTVTNNIGTSYVRGAQTETSALGKDISIDEMTANGITGDLQLKTGSTVNRTYKITQIAACNDDVYLRWISPQGEYKYYALKYGSESLVSKQGGTFNYYPLSQDPIGLNSDYYKNRLQLKNKSVMKSIECGEPSADENKTIHLETLLQSLKVWMYDVNKWVEVQLKDMTIGRKRLENRREINVSIILPEYNTQSL